MNIDFYTETRAVFEGGQSVYGSGNGREGEPASRCRPSYGFWKILQGSVPVAGKAQRFFFDIKSQSFL